jgi:hypothetical protein
MWAYLRSPEPPEAARLTREAAEFGGIILSFDTGGGRPTLPPHPLWHALGLTKPVRTAIGGARHAVRLTLAPHRSGDTAAIVAATRLMDRVAREGRGVVQDIVGCRHFPPGGWRQRGTVSDRAVVNHVSYLPGLDAAGERFLYSHGMRKWGLPEARIAVPVPGEAPGAAWALITLGQILVSGEGPPWPSWSFGDPDKSIVVCEAPPPLLNAEVVGSMLELVGGDGEAGAQAGVSALAAAAAQRSRATSTSAGRRLVVSGTN